MKRILYIIGFIAAILVIVGIWMYNKPHRNIQSARADYQFHSTDLYNIYQGDETASDKLYLDKIIKVTGKVASVSMNDEGVINVSLEGDGMFGVMCSLDENLDHERTDFQVGEEVTFKGACSGFLMDVVIVRCVEVR